MNMRTDTSQLAARQKRLKFWQELLSSHCGHTPHFDLLAKLKLYRSLLTRWCENSELAEADYSALVDCERQLEAYAEDLRRIVPQTLSSSRNNNGGNCG